MVGSMRAYARHRGCTLRAVQKAVASGRVSLMPDGSVDFATADAAWLANSRHRRDWALAQLHERVLEGRPDAVVALLGLSYKADTASTKNSPADCALPRMTDPQPRMPAATAPCSASGAAASVMRLT